MLVNLGKVLPKYKGLYNRNEGYQYLDVVYNPTDGITYISTQRDDTNWVTPSEDSRYWMVLIKPFSDEAKQELIKEIKQQVLRELR